MSYLEPQNMTEKQLREAIIEVKELFSNSDNMTKWMIDRLTILHDTLEVVVAFKEKQKQEKQKLTESGKSLECIGLHDVVVESPNRFNDTNRFDDSRYIRQARNSTSACRLFEMTTQNF